MIRLVFNDGSPSFPAKLIFFFALCSSVQAFLSFPGQKSKSCRITNAALQSSEWSVGDDWSSMSYENPDNTIPDSSKIFNQDIVTNVAREIEAAGTATLQTEDELWINDAVDEIHNSFSRLDPPLYDTGSESYSKTVNDFDDMGNEIAMVVRCNERPEELLVESGRALPPLTNDEKNNPLQLVKMSKDGFQSTDFLEQAVSKMFHQHATKDLDGELVLDREGVANWMTQALRTEKHEGKVSPHDKRVIHIISKYSAYGTGRLLECDLQELYFSTIVDDSVDSSKSPERQLQHRQPFVGAVFRDIRNHGILPPVEAERKALADEIRAKYGAANAVETKASAVDTDMIMDECEILDWDPRSEQSQGADPSGSDRREASGSKSSHKVLEMAGDNKTPLYVKDGDFSKSILFFQLLTLSHTSHTNALNNPLLRSVFIDEESCIGCMQVGNTIMCLGKHLRGLHSLLSSGI